MRAFLAILLISLSVYAAPVNFEDALKQLQQQVEAIEKSMVVPVQEKEKEDALKVLYAPAEENRAWQPSKRMVAWQPMKRTVTDDRASCEISIEITKSAGTSNFAMAKPMLYRE